MVPYEELAKSCEEGKAQSEKSAGIFSSQTKQQLNRTGILTALAIGLHNIPEGVATYIGKVIYIRLAIMVCLDVRYLGLALI